VSATSIPPVHNFDEPFDEFSLLKSWCEEVIPRKEESRTSLNCDSVDAIDFTNDDFVTVNDDELYSMQWGEPVEIGQPVLMDVGVPNKKAREQSHDSLRGQDTTNPMVIQYLPTSTLDAWSTASIPANLAENFSPQSKRHPRSDPCIPELRTDRGIDSIHRHQQGTTTFMLRNIPNRVKVEDIQDRIAALGFGETFDFLYMPLDLQSKQNKGYAFINLINETVAADFAERFNGTRFEGRLSTKEVLVCNATAQGVVPTLRTIKHSNWSKKEHMPIVRVEGKLMHLTPLAACEILRIEAQYGS
jgi:hypothetical protein